MLTLSVIFLQVTCQIPAVSLLPATRHHPGSCHPLPTSQSCPTHQPHPVYPSTRPHLDCPTPSWSVLGPSWRWTHSCHHLTQCPGAGLVQSTLPHPPKTTVVQQSIPLHHPVLEGMWFEKFKACCLGFRPGTKVMKHFMLNS